jgi:voltage-gated potassium channel
MDHHDKRTVIRVSIATGILALGGTIGFMAFEGLKFVDSLYETLVLLLTHYDHYGFKNAWSRILVLFLILCSYAIIAYLLKLFAEYMMGLGGNVRKLRVKTKVDKLKEHYIICGYGRVGSQVSREMHQEDVPFVVLDRDPARVEEALAAGYLAVALDSSSEGSLQQVGIERAKGLVACLNDDSLNLFVTLAARSLNSELYIVARANRPENEVKLIRAGADRVALPYRIGGYHMASMALRPNVVDYMDIVSGKSGMADLEVEEMIVGEQSQLAGRRLGKALAEGEIGATVIAINGADGTSRVRPTGKEIIYPGDRLVILGSKRDLTNASALIR